MKYNPAIHHRKSIRLKGYDYSKAGAYFVTMCIQERKCLLGNISDEKMILNNAGIMIDKWWWELRNKFNDVELDEYIIMPDHFHGIVFIVGADLRVCPKIKEETKTFVSPEMIVSAETEAEAKTNANARQSEEIRGGERVDKVGEPEIELQGEDGNKEGEHVGSPQRDTPQRDTPQRDTPQRDTPQRDTPQRKSSLSQIIQWFKTMTTNEFLREIKNNNWEPFHGKLWQKNYYERIIRNEIELNKVREYIINNPSRWKSDSKNPDKKK